MNKLTLIIITLLGFSCSNKSTTVETSHQQLVQVITDEILENPTQLLFINDGLIVVVDEFGLDGFIKVLDSKYNLLLTAGKLGNGPFEFSDYPSISFGEDKTLYIFDNIRNNLFSLDVQTGTIKEELFSMPENELIEEIIKVTSNSYIFQPGGYQNLFTELPREVGGTIKSSPLSIKNLHYISLEEPRKLTFSSNYLTKRPGKDEIAGVFNYYDELIITDRSDLLFHEILFEDLNYTSNQTNIAFTSIFGSKDKIYSIYYGKNIEDLAHPKECKLLIFDWNGEMKNMIVLDHPLNQITVNEDESILLGINPMNEENPIFKLDLKIN